MTVRPRVLIDCDGVVCDFLNPALATMNRLLGTSFKLEEMTSWHLFDAFDIEISKEIQDACYAEWKSPGWCRNLPIYMGAVEGVEALQEIADVYFCTSPMNGATWASERERWIQDHFGKTFTRKKIISTDAKYVCSADILVDDKTEHCIAWKQCHPMGMAVRWHQVTNHKVPYFGPQTNSWPQVRTWAEAFIHTGDRLWMHRTT